MTPSGLDEARRWIAQAEKDMDAAQLLLSGGHFNLTCFLSQQAAEKAAKGFLYAQGVEDPWGHSVGQLLGDAVSFDSALKTLTVPGVLLDKFYVPTRYPNGLPGGIPAQAYSDQEARQAMDWARQIIDQISAKLRCRPD